MNILIRTLQRLIGLFIDDGRLALTLLGVLIAVELLTHLGAIGDLLATMVLVAGTIIALLVNVIQAALTKSDR